ncbi:hypothetical protein LC092_03390 [Stappia stellulata]|uniref:hypothetical protein n=1 Tax=Stappia stellulata TaxID=71235 RepID=UPI001CD5C5D8|nr:hypothetical protein [Stappia stellulata]MCA1241476.1 hypothetical protein [Stappia stellulata]
MQIVASGTLGREFTRSADALRRHQHMFRLHEERERKAKAEKAENDMSDMLDAAVLVVTAAEIADFRVELETYDAATVAALQENGLALEQVRDRLDAMLARAHVLPDGRRVFKTEDGLQVFDEHGNAIEAQTIAPQEIDDARPRWEAYKATFDEEQHLTQERMDLLDYQARLDGARDRLDAGDLSREEFDALREDLKEHAPDAVRARVPGLQLDAGAERDLASGRADPAAAEDLSISPDMISTGPIPGMGR